MHVLVLDRLPSQVERWAPRQESAGRRPERRSQRVSNSGGKSLAADEFASIPLDTQATSVGVLGNDVEVHMEDSLISRGPVVLKNVVVVASSDCHDGPGNSWEHPANSCSTVVAEFVQEGDPLLRDHQDMPKTQRGDIEEGQGVVILIHPVAWDFTVEDASKDGLFGGHSEHDTS